MKRIVIVGAGHAAAQLCASLAELGGGALPLQVTLIGAEGQLPYQRPPLSKAFLKAADTALAPIRPETFYEQHGIALRLDDPVVAIDRGAHAVTLRSGAVLPYDALVIATGARPRVLAALPPGQAGVHYLRSAADAQALRERLHAASAVRVIGGGFIGLEIAATARQLAKSVTVIESAPRLLPRALSPELGDFLLAHHRASGIAFLLDAPVGTDAPPADLTVVGIGAEPEIALAQAAGLACGHGIEVDAQMRTSDPDVLAIGDCTQFPLAGSNRRLRLESIQNANDQARVAAATLLGQAASYAALPWFWSEQGAVRIQIAGLIGEGMTRHLRGAPADGKFSVLHYAGERLAAVETVNLPMDHLAARKLLELGISPPPDVAADPAVALKSLVPA